MHYDKCDWRNQYFSKHDCFYRETLQLKHYLDIQFEIDKCPSAQLSLSACVCIHACVCMHLCVHVTDEKELCFSSPSCPLNH